MKQIRVIIAEDQSIFRKGLVAALTDYDNLHIAGEAANGKELLNLLSETLCDVVLLDLRMPELDGFSAVPLILKQFPQVKIIVLTIIDEEQYILHLIQLGVHGYLIKNEEPKIIVHTIEEVFKHGSYFDHKTAHLMQKGLNKKQNTNVSIPGKVHFTEQDRKFLALLCKDYSTEEIADKMCLTARTVRHYRIKMMNQTDSHTIAGVVAYALKYKLVE